MYFEEFHIGQTFSIEDVVMEKDKMIAFSKVYDNIPIHTDEEYAKNTRFGKVIAAGFMTFLEVWAKSIENDIYGEELIAGKSTKLEWFAPVFADDVLSSEIVVSALTKRNNYNGILETTLDIYNQDKVLVLKAVTESIVSCKPQ